MNPLPKFLRSVLLSAFALAAAPAAQAQVGVNINIGAPVWGPPVPAGVQYYYIPEIDGYYDLYTQEYIVYQDDYWVPLPQLYGYDPYQFHPVVIAYRGREPWQQLSYYHSRYAYRPYQSYGRGGGYYSNGYGRPGYSGYSRGYDNRNAYSGDHRNDHRGYDNRGYDNRGYDHRNDNWGYDNHRDDNRSQGGYSGDGRGNTGQNQNGGYGGGRGNTGPGAQPGQSQQGGRRDDRGGYDQGQGQQGGQGGRRNEGGRGRH